MINNTMMKKISMIGTNMNTIDSNYSGTFGIFPTPKHPPYIQTT